MGCDACKRPRSNDSDARCRRLKSTHRYGIDRARASWVFEADLDNVSVPRRDGDDTDGPSGVDLDAALYASVEYHG